MAEAVISGTITAPVATGGPTASLYLGSPKVSPSATPDTLSYEEAKSATLKLTSSDGIVAVSLDSVDSGDLVYVGCDFQVDAVLNAKSFVLGDGTGAATDGGFILLRGADVTTLTVEAKLSIETTITVAIYGD